MQREAIVPRRITEARKRRQTLTESQADHLLTGHCLGPDLFPFRDDTERERLWRENRAELMQYIDRSEGPGYFAQNGLPWGTRPSGWWSYEAKAPRRRIRNTSMAEAIGRRMHKGIPALWTEYIDTAAEFEMEVKYLRRHGLLLPEEKTRITA